jgi:hypothetical protein
VSASLQSGRRATPGPVTRSQRGPSGPIAALFALVVAGIGGAIDVITGPGLRITFACCLIGGAAIAALLVRRRDVLWVVFAPPLICVAIALVSIPLTNHGLIGLAADYLTHGFPPIAIATGVAAIIAVIRKLGGRST